MNGTISVKVDACLFCGYDIAISKEKVNMCLEKVSTKIFIADIFILATAWEQFMCPSIWEWEKCTNECVSKKEQIINK